MTTSRTLDTNVYRMIISWNKDTSGKIEGLTTLDSMLKDFTYDTLNEFYKETILLWLNEETKAFNEHMSQLDADSETYFSNNKALKTAKDTLFSLQDAIRNTMIKDQKVLVNKIKEALIAIINFKRQYNQSKEALANAWHQENIRLNKNLTKAEDTYHNQKIELIEVFKKTRDDHDKTEKSPYGRIIEISVSIPHSKLTRYKTGTSLKQARDLITKYEQALTSDRNNKIPAKGFLEIIISALGLDHYIPATAKSSKPIPTDSLQPDNHASAASKTDSNSSSSDNQKHEALAPPERTLTRLEPTKTLLEKTETENVGKHKAAAAKPIRSTISTGTVKPAKRLDRTLFFTNSPQPESAPVFEPKVDTEFSLISSLSVALESASTYLQYFWKLLNPDTPTADEVVTVSEQNKAHRMKPANDEVFAASEQKNVHRVKPTNQSYFQRMEGPNKNAAATIPSRSSTTQSAALETENSYIQSLKTELQKLEELCDDHNIEQPSMIERIQEALDAKDAIFLGQDKKTIEEHAILYQKPLEKKLSVKFLSHSKTDADQSRMRSLRTTDSIYLAKHLKDIYEQIGKSCKNHKYNLDAEQDLQLHAKKYDREELTGLTQMRKLAR